MGFRPKQPQLTLLWFPFILSFFPLPLNFFFSSREQHGQREWNENKSFCWSGSSLRQRSLRLITHLFKKRRGSSSTNLFIHSTILPFIQSISMIERKSWVEWLVFSLWKRRAGCPNEWRREEERRKHSISQREMMGPRSLNFMPHQLQSKTFSFLFALLAFFNSISLRKEMLPFNQSPILLHSHCEEMFDWFHSNVDWRTIITVIYI